MAWVGHEGEAPTWQVRRLAIYNQARCLVNGFNRRLRHEAQQQPNGAAATVAHGYVGKEVAKFFSHGAVFVGYVTEYCPSEMSGEEVSPELFYIEHDGGGEEGMEAE